MPYNSCRTCLTNRMGFISLHIMPLVISSLRADTHTYRCPHRNNCKKPITRWLSQLANPKQHRAPYHVSSTKLFESFSYSNVFDRYERLFISGQKWQLFNRFKPFNGYFSVVSLYVSEENCILLESPFHVELSLCFNSVY